MAMRLYRNYVDTHSIDITEFELYISTGYEIHTPSEKWRTKTHSIFKVFQTRALKHP